MATKWKSDFTKFVISANFEQRGWEEIKDELDESWNIYWASTGSIRNIFGQDSMVKLRPDQLVNHFPNHYELTHKVKTFTTVLSLLSTLHCTFDLWACLGMLHAKIICCM
jgi:hypothetical protein